MNKIFSLGKIIVKLLAWLDQRTNGQRIGLLFFAGLLIGFSFAPFYLFPLLAICYPLLLLILFKSKNFMEAFSFGWWFGFGQCFMGLIWVAVAFEYEDRYPNWIGYLAVAGLALAMAIYYGLATGIVWRLFRHKDPHQYALSIVLSFVVLWNLSEWLRGHLFTGFPWNLSGYIWGFSDIMLQSAAIWGIYGLGLFTIFLALVPYLLIYMPKTSKSLIGIFAGLFIIVGGLVAFGMIQLSEPTKFREDVKLKLVQANINQKDKWDPAKKSLNFIKYLNMSKSDPQEGITHVIWPETAVTYFLDTEPSRRYLIADMLNQGSLLMTGFPRVKRVPKLQAWNSFITVDSEGNFGNIYDKYHLVPFGEYTPDFFSDSLSVLGLGMLVEGFSYSKGDGVKTLHLKDGLSVGPLICYEIIFPGAVVDQRDRPDWLLNITNDAWYGSFNGPYQHLVQTRVRAIEEGLPIIRSAGTGISAVIDSQGRIVDDIGLNQTGTLVSFLPAKRDNLTLYSILSDCIFYGIMLILSGVVILILRQKDKHMKYKA